MNIWHSVRNEMKVEVSEVEKMRVKVHVEEYVWKQSDWEFTVKENEMVVI